MQGAITDELRVLVTAEVDKAIRSLKSVDSKTSETEKLFKSLGGSIAGAFSIKAVSDFARKSAEAWRVQKEAVSVMNQVLKSTGAEAWTSSAELKEMAASLQQVTNYGDETITSMHGVLLGFRNITGKNFEHASKAILDMATVMKMDLSSAAQVVGKALDDPINGLGSLSRQGFHFTEQQKQMLKAMVEAGDMMGAQKIILEELDGTYGGAAEAAADLGTQVKNSAGDVLEGFGKVFSFLGEHSGALKLTKEALDAIAGAFNNVERNAARLSGGDKYNAWYEGLEDTERLKEATDQLAHWEAELRKCEAAHKSFLENSAVLASDIGYDSSLDENEWTKELEQLQAQVNEWQARKDNLREEIQYKKDLQSITNAETRAEEELGKAVAQVGETYKKFAKDDPAYKLKELQKALEEISKQRADIKPIDTKELEAELKRLNELKFDLVRQSAKAGGSFGGFRIKEQADEAAKEILSVQQKIAAAKKHNAGLLDIDTNELNANLDAAEKAILKKMDEIKANGKKTWQEIFSDTTGVDKSLFSTGEQAADEYLKGLHARVEEEKEIGALLGKAISPRKALESEMAEIEKTIRSLASIPEG
ncbi:MAG: phage tail length tape measure family protein, partial [Treponema sp.]|nr:phage tail length tape measure family protein [Treponema sp.]